MALRFFTGNLALDVVQRMGLFSAFIFIFFDVVDMRQTSNLFPSTDRLKNCHILIVGVIPAPQTREDVLEGIEPLALVLVENEKCSE